MAKMEEISIKFWVEKNDALSASSGSTYSGDLTSVRFSLPSTLKSSCETWLVSQQVDLAVFYNAIFGLLCNRYISSSYISFASGVGSKNKNNIQLVTPLSVVSSKLDEKTKINNYIKSISKQLNNPKVIDKQNGVRYLLLQKSNSLTLKGKKHKVAANQFPLIVMFDPEKIGSITCYYNPAFFDADVIEEISKHLIELIKSVTSSVAQSCVTQLPILTESEKQFYFDQLKPSVDDNDKFDINTSVVNAFSMAVNKYNKKCAVCHQDGQITYEELDTLSSLVACYLIDQGVRVGDNVCVYSERNILLIVYMLAIFKTGAVFVPINSKYPTERIQFIVVDSNASVVLTDQPIRFSNLDKINSVQFQSLDEIHALSTRFDTTVLPTVTGKQVAYIIYTSGTTGQPKGVMIEHRSILNLTNWYCSHLGINEYDHASQFASQGFDTFFCETIPFLLTGASVHIIDDQIKLTPSLFFQWLETNKITICDIPTAYAKVLFSLQWPSLPSLKMVKIGGESINRYPDKIFSFDIWNTYGPSEATVETTYKKIYTAYSSQDAQHNQVVPPIGKPLKNSSIWIVDQYNQLVPQGVAGELLIGGVNLAKGYWNKPELTKIKFIDHLFLHDTDSRLYRTGDLVRLLSGGSLEYVGRTDDQVKIRGYRIELGEIESIMSKYPDVRDVAVIIKETANHEKQLFAYVSPNLEKQRFIFQERCLLKVNDHCIEAITENFSKGGLRLSGVSEQSLIGKLVITELRLPGATYERSLRGHVIWQQDDQCGIEFDLSEDDQAFVDRSIQFYLSSQNTQDIVSRSAMKRNIHSILKTKLPEYMIPTSVVTLLDMPMTFSGKIDKKSLPDPAQYLQRARDVIQPKTEKEKKLFEIWAELLQTNQISLSDSFFDLGGNSLLVAELSIRILETFGILIPVNVLFDLPYLSIQAEYLETGGTQYNKQSHVQELIEKDIVLPEHIHCTGVLSKHLYAPKNILLTGAGGFLGIFILKSLLETTNATIYCFVRKGDFETPVNRLISVVENFQLQDYISISNRRIVIIGGDLAQNDFGLPSTLYEALSKKIDIIYHCGAQVNTMAAYDAMRGSNVLGTLEVIKFAVHNVDKPIHYISTLSSAYQKNDAGFLDEVFPSETYGELTGGYAISKWAAERLLTAVNQRGLPIAIYRSGYIGGWSEKGITNLNDSLLMLIKGCIQLGVAPALNEKITLLPVDFVANAIATIGLKFPEKTAVYHVDHPDGIMWTDLVEWLNQYGYKVQMISLPRWQKLLSMISKQNALYPLLPYYLSLKEGHSVPETSTTNFLKTVADCQLSCPAIDSALLTLYFNFLRSVNFLPALVDVKIPNEMSKS